MSHTPGPWRIVLNTGRSVNGASITDPSGFVVARIPRIADRSYNVKEADAALIAAAPDLLAACKSILDTGVGFTDSFKQAKEAVAKAEGR